LSSSEKLQTFSGKRAQRFRISISKSERGKTNEKRGERVFSEYESTIVFDEWNGGGGRGNFERRLAGKGVCI
jgi:hypothetical protein